MSHFSQSFCSDSLVEGFSPVSSARSGGLVSVPSEMFQEFMNIRAAQIPNDHTGQLVPSNFLMLEAMVL